MVLVKTDRAAGCMDYQDTFIARFADNLIHSWCKLSDSSGCPFAPVLIPHIADNYGGLFGIPFEFLLYDFKSTGAIR